MKLCQKHWMVNGFSKMSISHRLGFIWPSQGRGVVEFCTFFTTISPFNSFECSPLLFVIPWTNSLELWSEILRTLWASLTGNCSTVCFSLVKQSWTSPGLSLGNTNATRDRLHFGVNINQMLCYKMKLSMKQMNQ